MTTTPVGDGTATVDPVCGMKVDPAEAAASENHGSKTFYFCGKGCAAKFRADPNKYLQPKIVVPVPGAPSDSATEYICPMDPEVHQSAPGSCPKCGMALEPATLTAPATKTEYTCPMHPEVVRNGPGDCPICGMALEPRTITIDETNPELDGMTRRLWIGGVLTIPLLAIMVSDLVASHPVQHLLPGRALGWLEFAIATPVALWAGGRSFSGDGLRSSAAI